jgi:hypothetical protein
LPFPFSLHHAEISTICPTNQLFPLHVNLFLVVPRTTNRCVVLFGLAVADDILPNDPCSLHPGSTLKQTSHIILFCRTIPSITHRDQRISDRIIPLPHLHLYFFIGGGAERILHGCGYGCRFFRMSDMVRSRIGVEADVD